MVTAYDNTSPKAWTNGGHIVLGTGGDNSNSSFGTFFEGADTAGRPSDATDTLVLQNVHAAGYGKWNIRWRDDAVQTMRVDS